MVKYSEDVAGEYSSYLDDESSIAKNTRAKRIWFPKTHDEVIHVVNQAKQNGEAITISGGGTGISGGRAPAHGWILATDDMTAVEDDRVEQWTDRSTGIEYGIVLYTENDQSYLKVPVGMSLKSIQNWCRENNLMYPPDPTERTSYIGGNVSTNASGARSFKFGATRNWVQNIKVVLASGESIQLKRTDEDQEKGVLEFDSLTTKYSIPIPELQLPNVTKHVAGPVLTKNSDPIDIFIGTNGIFGIITEVTLKLLTAPTKIISMFAYCESTDQAFDLIVRCQQLRQNNSYPFPMSVEYLDANAITIMQQKDSRIESSAAVVLLEQDIYSKEEEDRVLGAWQEIFNEFSISNIDVALDHTDNEHHKFLRHWVPEWLIKTTKDYGFPIFVSDTSVPPDKFRQFIDYLDTQSRRFEKIATQDETLCTTMIGHVGDSHPHLCFIPTNQDQADLAQQIMTELIEKSVELGGSMASEHGLGKKRFNDQPAIIKQYGQKGIDVVRQMKEILDPQYILCPDNIIPAS